MASKQTDNSLKVEVDGLKDFQRELKALDSKLPTELRKANKKAADVVADDARARYRSQPGLGPRAAASLKVQAQQREASIVIGKISTRRGSAIILGVEFGGSTDPNRRTSRGGHTTQFEPYRGKEGYALYPSIRMNRERVIDVYGELLEEAARAAFPN